MKPELIDEFPGLAGLEIIYEKYARDCKRCGLHKTRKKVVFGTGNSETPDIAFLGEAPGCLLPNQYINYDGAPRLVTECELLPFGFIQKHSGIYTGEVVEVKALGIPLTVTIDHKVRVRRSDRQYSHSRRRLLDEEWVTAGNLTKDMYLVIRKSMVKRIGEPKEVVSLSKYEVEKKHYKNRVPDEIRVTQSVATVFGLFLGDGCVSDPVKGVVRWCLSCGYKGKYVELVCNFVAEIGLKPKVVVRGERITIFAYSTKLAKFFSGEFYSDPPGMRAAGVSKKVPAFIRDWQDVNINWFLFGWYEADGKHTRNLTKSRVVSSVSRSAIFSGVWLFLRLGIVPTLAEEPPTGKGKQVCFGLGIGNSGVKHLGWPIETHDKKARILYNEDSDNFYVPISSVKMAQYSGKVYDFTTQTGDYSTPFVVHNSNEDNQGYPFVGSAGGVLNALIEKLGYTRADVYITNVLLCRPPGNRDPLPEEAEACSVFYRAQLKAVKPKVIVCLGAVAARALLKKGPSVELGSLRGKWWSWNRTPVMVTYHPAFLLRTPSMKKRTWADMQKVMERLRGNKKPPEFDGRQRRLL